MAELDRYMPDLFGALDDLNRENTGFCRCVARNAEASRVKIGQNVLVPNASASDPVDIVESMSAPTATNPDVGTNSITIEKSEAVRINLSGEEETGTNAAGTTQPIMRARVASAYRKLTNKIEAYVADKAVKGASRAYGDGTATMFTTADKMVEFAQMSRILDDSGAPQDMRNFVVSNEALANMRANNTLLLKACEAGTDDFIRRGFIDPVMNLRLYASAGLTNFASGGKVTTAYAVAAAGKVHDKVINIDSGTGTIAAGDVITFGTDTTNRYVVTKGTDAAGTIEIGGYGLVKEVAKAATIAIVQSYAPCVAFQSDAIQLAIRAPSRPTSGDSCVDQTIVQDAGSGLIFDVALYKGYHMNTLEIGVAYGAAVLRGENVAVLAGK